MSRITKFFILLFVGIIVLSFFQTKYLLSSDILQTIPQFAEGYGWERPGNSLLADPVFQFETWRILSRKRLLDGEIPFINSQNSLGVPFFANQISAIFFPLNFIYYLFPVANSLFFIHALKLYFLLLFTYLYLRSLKVEKLISFTGGIFSCFMGFSLVWLQWPQTNVFLLFPLVLYLSEKIKTKEKNQFLSKFFLSIAYFLLVLAGHPETAFQIALLHLAYILFRVRPFKLVLETIGFSVIGIGLGAFAVLPFIEYLSISNALISRSIDTPITLPLHSFIFQIFPFILGSPTSSYYKPFSDSLNFQELVGGYVGLSLFLLGLISGIKLEKSSIKYFWVFCLIFCFFTAYAIFPFSLLNHLPILSVSGNHRLIGFGGYSLIILSALYIQQGFKGRGVYRFSEKALLAACTILCALAVMLFLPGDKIIFDIKYFEHIKLLKAHVIISVFTTFVFFISLGYFYKTKKILYLFLASCLAVFQMLNVFYNYNYFTPKDIYYPNTALTQTLSKYPKGVYLEVGNPSLTENLNLTYGFSSLENYDALDLAAFKEKYDKSFPEKNQWGNSDVVDKGALDDFGVSYIISDYDLRLTKSDIQPIKDKVLDPLLKSSPVLVSLPQEKLTGLRLLPATFNRKNNCTLMFIFLDEQKNQLGEEEVSCKELYNNMYFTIEVKDEASKYLLISTNTDNPDNAVSFFGDGEHPYIGKLQETDKDIGLTLIDMGKTWFLFSNPDARFINAKGLVSDMSISDENIKFVVNQDSHGKVTLKRTNFPGWTVNVDGKPYKLLNDVFLAIDLLPGAHIIEFSYIPYSFYFGLVMSLLCLGFLMVYFIRNIRKRDIIVNSQFYRTFSKKLDTYSWIDHFLVLSVSLIISITVFALGATSLNLDFRTPTSTAINWFTVHSYPRQQDYFYFVSGVIFITISTLTIWSIMIWKKIK